MRIVSFTEARKRLKGLLDQVNDDVDCTVITRRDAPHAVVMSLSEYNALMETVHLLHTPANANHLAQSIEQHRQSETIERPLSDAE